MNILLLIFKMKKIIQIVLLITFFDFETSKNKFKFENNRIVKYMHYKWIKQQTQ